MGRCLAGIATLVIFLAGCSASPDASRPTEADAPATTAGAENASAARPTSDPRHDLAEIPVRTRDNVDERSPAGFRQMVAWTEDKRVRGDIKPYGLFVKRAGRPKVRISARGIDARLGGIDGGRVVYNAERVAVAGRYPSDIFIKMFDLRIGRHVRLPSAVRSAHGEYALSISGDWLMFIRCCEPNQVILFNLKSRENRVVHQAWGLNEPWGGQVNGNYAVWAGCRRGRCGIYRHDIAARKTTLIEQPPGANFFGPSVTPDGTVYFVREKARVRGFANGVRLVRRRAGVDEVLVRFPRDTRADDTYAVQRGKATVVFYQRVVDGQGRLGEIYKIVDVR